MTNPAPQNWTRYWKRPTITSFGQVFPDNYDDSILKFWQEQLTGEPDHVIDIGCGNGALTWIANDMLNHGPRKTRITGVDFADINPFKTLRRKKRDFPDICFVGNTAAENLPFANQSVDLIISQFGIEYTNVDASIPEITRILTPGGGMSFILHHKESSIIRGATLHLDDFRTVLNDIAIHDYALKLDDLYLQLQGSEARQSSIEIRELVTKINMLANQVRDLVRDYPSRGQVHLYMERLNQALADARNNKDVDRKAQITLASDTIRSHINRIEDLQAAALSADDRQHLIALIERAGFEVTEMATLTYKQEPNIGTTLVARRRIA